MARCRATINNAGGISCHNYGIPVIFSGTRNPIADPGNPNTLDVGTGISLDNDTAVICFVADEYE